MSDDAGGARDGGMSMEAQRRMEARLGSLERDARRMRSLVRWLSGGLVLALGLAAATALRPELFDFVDLAAGPDVIETHGIVLLDDEGTPRGSWAVDEEGNARLVMMDQERRQRVSISVLEGGFPGLSLINAAGQRRVALGVLPDETTSLVFADAAGVPRTVLGLTRGDAANLVFADAQGVSRIGLGLDGAGVGSVMLPDDSGESTSSPEGTDQGGS